MRQRASAPVLEVLGSTRGPPLHVYKLDSAGLKFPAPSISPLTSIPLRLTRLNGRHRHPTTTSASLDILDPVMDIRRRPIYFLFSRPFYLFSRARDTSGTRRAWTGTRRGQVTVSKSLDRLQVPLVPPIDGHPLCHPWCHCPIDGTCPAPLWTLPDPAGP